MMSIRLWMPRVIVSLIGERPGVGTRRSDERVYDYRPQPDSTDADRDMVCNIFNGGTRSRWKLSAYVVEYIKRMLPKHQAASGIKLKLIEQGAGK